jgi:hypothetical protein
MASIITPTVDAATSSSDFTLAAGSSTTLALYGPVRPFGTVSIERLVAGNYIPIGLLTDGNPIQVLTANGTFRVSKGPSQTQTGVDRD